MPFIQVVKKYRTITETLQRIVEMAKTEEESV